MNSIGLVVTTLQRLRKSLLDESLTLLATGQAEIDTADSDSFQAANILTGKFLAQAGTNYTPQSLAPVSGNARIQYANMISRVDAALEIIGSYTIAEAQIYATMQAPIVTSLRSLISEGDKSSAPTIGIAVASIKKFQDIANSLQIPDEVIYVETEDAIDARITEIFASATAYLDRIRPDCFVTPTPNSFASTYQETLFKRGSMVDFTEGTNGTNVGLADTYLDLVGTGGTQNTALGSFVTNKRTLEAFQEASAANNFYSIGVSDSKVAINFVNAPIKTHNTFSTAARYLGYITCQQPLVHGAIPKQNWDLLFRYIGVTSTATSAVSGYSDASGVFKFRVSVAGSPDITTAAYSRDITLSVANGQAYGNLDDISLDGELIYLHITLLSWNLADSTTAPAVAHSFIIDGKMDEASPSDVSGEHAVDVFDKFYNLKAMDKQTFSAMFNSLQVLPSSTRAGLLQILLDHYDNMYLTDWSLAIRLLFEMDDASSTTDSGNRALGTNWTPAKMREYLAGGVMNFLDYTSDITVIDYLKFWNWLKLQLSKAYAVMKSSTQSRYQARLYLSQVRK